MSKNVVVAIIVLIVLVALILLFTGGPEEPIVPDPDPQPDPPVEEPVSGTGVISYIDLEGGFYGLLADDGAQYLPLNLMADFEEDGLKVEFVGHLAEDAVGIHMWGTPIELVDIWEAYDFEPEENDEEILE